MYPRPDSRSDKQEGDLKDGIHLKIIGIHIEKEIEVMKKVYSVYRATTSLIKRTFSKVPTE